MTETGTAVTEPHVIRDSKGRPVSVVISWDEWSRMTRSASDEDLYRSAKAQPSRVIPGVVLNAILDGVNPIRAFREHRNLSQQTLANQASLSVPYLSQLETGRRKGSVATLRKLAELLDAAVDILAGEK